MMLLNSFAFHRPEGTKSYGQSDFGDVNPHLPYVRQDIFSKMKTCGRRGGAPVILRIDRIVAVLFFQLVMNIWRKGHLSERIEDHFKYPLIGKRNYPAAVIGNRVDMRFQPPVAKGGSITGQKFLSRAHYRLPGVTGEPF